jgi:OFA family oxalate/formate antiporter-like MFS transporter
MLLPWAFPAAFGPLLFAYLRQATGGYTQALYLIAGVMTVAMILPLLVSPPRAHITAEDLPAESGVPMQAVAGSDGEV